MAGQRISIITVCFNNIEELKTTIAHIDAQSMPPFEHIIINGSTSPIIDEWLKAQENPAWRRWISESDNGISDAFNKGIDKAQGDIIHLQNAGDYYFSDTILAQITQAFTTHPDAQWLHGKYVQFRGGIWVEAGKAFDKDLLFRGMRTIGHPTMFVRHEMYDRHGLFDIHKRIAMDYDFLVRLAPEPFVFLPQPLVVFTPGGLSNQRIAASLREVISSYEQKYGFSLKARFWALRTFCLNKATESGIGKYLYKRLQRK